MLRPNSSQGPWLHVLAHVDPLYGGLSAVVPRLACQLQNQEGLRTKVAAFCAPDENHAPAGMQHRLSVWPLGRAQWLTQASLKKRFRAEVTKQAGIHIHGLWESSTFVAATEARRAGVPYVLSAHGMLEAWAMANKRLKKAIYAHLIERRNLSHAAVLHALTSAEAEDYRRFGFKGPIAIIPNGVEAHAHPDGTAFRQRFPDAAGKRLILFLGRIHVKKGLDLLLAAWKQLESQFPDALLVLAGPDFEGTLATVLKTIEDQQLNRRVLITGMLQGTDKWSALAAADFFVLPSLSEGLSVAVLEALSMGLPVILSEQCNLPQVAAAGAGWLVKTTTEDLVRALTLALQCSPATYRTMSACARNLSTREFTWTSVARRMAQLYRWVTSGASPTDVDMSWGAS